MLGASLAEEPVHRGAGFVIPAVRRAAYSAFLTAAQRLMKPIYSVEVQAPRDLAAATQRALNMRRGRVFADAVIPWTPLSLFHGYLPVIDSFGFETDLRTYTHGAAFCHQSFDHWAVVPGDPMKSSIVIRPLEASRNQELARDFMLKTRRRKGLPENVAVAKYFDDVSLLKAYDRAIRRRTGDADAASDSGSSSGSGSDSNSDSGSSSSSSAGRV
ncbi:Elongation factor 2 [Hondaea fermentalgiana]|uniref:Elongation factor 2 n=1 Tax=Hondaea fermentalgiana TaxID=2315210 RepID=A0A2R5G4V2_9STRA|nr:Elongation factor 2 [Hondaea fermentalgiana]|eukprot:GBG24818.1 Elongation factor 2 [Hondaea fermentalgiana]